MISYLCISIWDLVKKWIQWIRNTLFTASAIVLRNGEHGKKISAREGSDRVINYHLLFVATAELLQWIINEAWQTGQISLPLDFAFGLDYLISSMLMTPY
jgi:hypothetical protein